MGVIAAVAHLCHNAKLVPVTNELYLANGARLEVFGASRLHFEINSSAV